MIAERVLMGLLLAGIALGCAWILYPFLSALLWAAILVFTTWPVFVWVRSRSHLPGGLVSALMVLLSALVIVLPLALAAPGERQTSRRFGSRWKRGWRLYRPRRTGSMRFLWSAGR